jgi:hypothetical protein
VERAPIRFIRHLKPGHENGQTRKQLPSPSLYGRSLGVAPVDVSQRQRDETVHLAEASTHSRIELGGRVDELGKRRAIDLSSR